MDMKCELPEAVSGKAETGHQGDQRGRKSRPSAAVEARGFVTPRSRHAGTTEDVPTFNATLSPISQRRHAEEADLGWAAGVMDGEGCIHIARQTYGASGRRPTYRLRLNVSQNDELMLREFSWAVGVQGRLYSPKPVGKQNRVCHNLVYDGVGAFTVLERLHKYLRRKQAQSALAAEFRERCDIHRHTGPEGCPREVWELREWYYERMSSMKRG